MRYNPIIHGSKASWDSERKHHKGGGSSGSTTSTVTNTQQLPAYAQGYAEQLMSRAAGLSNVGYTPYYGQKIAALNTNQNNAINNTVNQATNGFQGQKDAFTQYQKTVQGDWNNPAMQKINSLYGDTASGKYLDPATNPYLAKTAASIGEAFNNTTGTQNLGLQRSAGAFGNSGLMQKMSGDNSTLANSLNNLYGQNYAAERGNQLAAQGQIGNAYLGERNNQLGAIANAGNMQNIGYTDASKLMGAGDIQRSYLQDLLNQQYSDWQAAQEQPYKNLDVLAKGLSGSVGNSGQSFSSSSTPYQSTPFANYLGGGLALAGLANGLLG